MKRLLLLGLAVVLASASFAYPSLSGPTGSVTLPDAAVQATGTLNVAAGYFFVENALGLGEGNITSLRVLYGIAPDFEVGAKYDFQQGEADIDESWDTWGVNAKYLTPLNLAGFNTAVGVDYTAINDTDEAATMVYLVGTRAFPLGETDTALRLSLGLNYLHFHSGTDGTTTSVRPFVNVDYAFARNMDVTAEFMTEDSDFDLGSLSSIALRYRFNPSLSAQIGFSNSIWPGVETGDQHNLLAGVSYTFGTAAGE